MSKIRASAKGKPCLVRIAGVCNSNNETTVFAHLGGGGMGAKSLDIFGAYCCSSCHDVVDGRVKSEYSKADIKLWFYDGMVRTQESLMIQGLIKSV